MPWEWLKEFQGEPLQLVAAARVAENAERYEEMAAAMKLFTEANAKSELATDQSNYLSVAYKNVVGSRPAAYRTISSWMNDLARGADYIKGAKKETLERYRSEVVKELNNVRNEVLKILQDYLIPNASDDESKVFYYKMQGDYYRYLAEVAEPSEHDRVVNGSLDAYKEATKIAESLSPTHPIKLGLALNFSVFHYEIMDSRDEAKRVAETAFNSAIGELDSIDEETYKDSTLIMQLLRDNLTLWASEKTGNSTAENAE